MRFNHLYTGESYIGTLANSADPDKMQHKAVFHQGLHCLLMFRRSSDKNTIFVRL